jgi:hypothetical protein
VISRTDLITSNGKTDNQTGRKPFISFFLLFHHFLYFRPKSSSERFSSNAREEKCFAF